MAVPSALEQLWQCAPEDRLAAVERLPPNWRRAARGLLEGPDPQGALSRALRLTESGQEDPLPAPVIALLHQGGYPARLLGLHGDPGRWDRPAPTRAELLSKLRDLGSRTSADEALARVRNEEYLRLTWREITGAPLEEVGAGLSMLADCCAEFAIECATQPDEVVVLAMGKLGGRELNFFSDIDLVFVHAEQDRADDSVKRRSRIHDGLRAAVKMLEGVGVWRPLFRVDLRLRPFGSRGPLSMSLDATEAYYEQHGRAWERQVWLRARPIAGNLALGHELIARLVPFTYRRSVGPEVFDEVAAMMSRARRENRGALSGSSIDVKLDAGGIREIEFFVQALQLLHGGRDASLRTTSTLRGLDRLAAAGLISDREHRRLVAAYRWYRRVEHRIQLAEGQQTHAVPGEDDAREQLVVRLGASDPGNESFPPDLAAFDRVLERHRARVRAIASTLMPPGDESPEIPDSEQRRRWAHSVLRDSGAPPHHQVRAFSELGLRDPEEATAVLQHLQGRPDGAFSVTGAARRGADELLLACLDSADPDTALRRLAQFAAARPAHYSAWRFFAEPGRAELLRQMGDLFGASEPLSRGLIGVRNRFGHADDGCISLLMEAGMAELPGRVAFDSRWAQSVDELAGDSGRRPQPKDEHPDGLDAQLLRFKHRELVRIGLFDLGRQADPLEIGASLSALADLIVEALMTDLSRDAAAFRKGDPSFSMGCFALGKYGMEAMDYGSDLDLMFVFDSTEPSGAATAQHAAQRVGRRMLARLQDSRRGSRLYEVDMRLRPSGRQGLLVSPLAGFRRYHAKRLPVWERLALVHLRPVAAAHFGPAADGVNDADLLHLVAAEIVPASVYPDDEAAYEPIAAETRALKQRIEREIARETREVYDVKSGRGGCLELELLIAALQLRAGREHAELRTSNGVPETLEKLGRLGLLESSEVRALGEAYRFLRRLLNRLRMSRGAGARGGADRLAVNSPRLASIARRMGLVDQQSLVSTFLHQREIVRAAFDHHLD